MTNLTISFKPSSFPQFVHKIIAATIELLLAVVPAARYHTRRRQAANRGSNLFEIQIKTMAQSAAIF